MPLLGFPVNIEASRVVQGEPPGVQGHDPKWCGQHKVANFNVKISEGLRVSCRGTQRQMLSALRKKRNTCGLLLRKGYEPAVKHQMKTSSNIFSPRSGSMISTPIDQIDHPVNAGPQSAFT